MAWNCKFCLELLRPKGRKKFALKVCFDWSGNSAEVPSQLQCTVQTTSSLSNGLDDATDFKSVCAKTWASFII